MKTLDVIYNLLVSWLLYGSQMTHHLAEFAVETKRLPKLCPKLNHALRLLFSQTALRSFRRRLRHSSMHKVLAAKVTAGKVGNTAMLLLQAHSKNKFINFKIKRHIKLIFITLQWARWRLESSCKSMQTRRILAISLHLESVLANITLEEWHGMRDSTYNLDVNSTSW